MDRFCSVRRARRDFAQTDEIQVYDAEIAEQGKFNVMVHSNSRRRAEDSRFPRRYHSQPLG